MGRVAFLLAREVHAEDVAGFEFGEGDWLVGIRDAGIRGDAEDGLTDVRRLMHVAGVIFHFWDLPRNVELALIEVHGDDVSGVTRREIGFLTEVIVEIEEGGVRRGARFSSRLWRYRGAPGLR